MKRTPVRSAAAFAYGLISLIPSLLLSFPELHAADPGSFFCEGPADKKEIALTFDDGPGPFTEKILEILRHHNVKATFFMLGEQIDLRPAIARKIADEGHELANHLYTHPNFYADKKEDPEKTLADEMARTEQALRKAVPGAARPYLLRMPHGYIRSWVKAVAKQREYFLVNWTFGCDWRKMEADVMAGEYIKNLRSGAVLLMHDGGKNRQRTVDALPEIIEEAKKQGYRLVTVSELLGVGGREMAIKRK